MLAPALILLGSNNGFCIDVNLIRTKCILWLARHLVCNAGIWNVFDPFISGIYFWLYIPLAFWGCVVFAMRRQLNKPRSNPTSPYRQYFERLL